MNVPWNGHAAVAQRSESTSAHRTAARRGRVVSDRTDRQGEYRMAGLFSDLKALDIASFIAGPAATTMLSDFGADVIKGDPPGTRDPSLNLYTARQDPLPSNNDMRQ